MFSREISWFIKYIKQRNWKERLQQIRDKARAIADDDLAQQLATDVEMVHDLKMKIVEAIEKQLSLSPATINQPSGTTNGSLNWRNISKVRSTVELSFRTLLNGNGSRKSKTNNREKFLYL